MGISHYEVICDDILHWAETYTGPPFHSILCDPPYHLTDVHTGGDAIPGKFGQRTEEQKRQQAETRKRGGFMGKTWDGGDIAFHPETWIALGKHLLPGAFIMVFGGTRTFHRLVCAIEDAGFEIRDTICWLHAQGFPKSLDISKNLDKMLGIERERNVTPLAVQWQGYGTALKPAVEFVVVAMKPCEGTFAQNAEKHGVAGLNIDGGRIGYANKTDKDAALAGDAFKRKDTSDKGWSRPWMNNPEIVAKINAESKARAQSGRWPANLILSHTPDCKLIGTKKVKSSQDVTRNEPGYAMAYGRQQTGHGYGDEDGLEEVEEWFCAEGCPVKILGEQSGESVSRASDYDWRDANNNNPTHIAHNIKSGVHFEDKGTAARFFFNADWSYEIAEQIEEATPFFYQSKASRSERDAGLGEIPTGSTCEHNRRKGQNNSTVRPDGSTRKSIAVHNIHPTVKSISLCKHLATLLLPPAAYAPRQILVPFCGSGSEMIACALAGFESIVGIEMDESYYNIARVRLSWWTSRMQETGSSDPSTILKRAKTTSKKHQPDNPTIGNQSKESVVQPGLL